MLPGPSYGPGFIMMKVGIAYTATLLLGCEANCNKTRRRQLLCGEVIPKSSVICDGCCQCVLVALCPFSNSKALGFIPSRILFSSTGFLLFIFYFHLFSPFSNVPIFFF